MSNSQDPPPPPPGPEPVCSLLALCVECGQGIELAFPIDHHSLALTLAQSSWFISVMSPPGQGPEAPRILGPLCTACAQQVYPPEVFAAAEERRQRLLQAQEAQEAR